MRQLCIFFLKFLKPFRFTKPDFSWLASFWGAFKKVYRFTPVSYFIGFPILFRLFGKGDRKLISFLRQPTQGEMEAKRSRWAGRGCISFAELRYHCFWWALMHYKCTLKSTLASHKCVFGRIENSFIILFLFAIFVFRAPCTHWTHWYDKCGILISTLCTA